MSNPRKVDLELEAKLKLLSELPAYTDEEYTQLTVAVDTDPRVFKTSPKFEYRGRLFTMPQLCRVLNSPEDLTDASIRKRIEANSSVIRAFVTPKYVPPSRPKIVLKPAPKAAVEEPTVNKKVKRAEVSEVFSPADKRVVRRVHGGRY